MPDSTIDGLKASVAIARDFEDELRELIPRYRQERKLGGDAWTALRSFVRIHLNLPDDEIGCLTLRELEQEIAIYLDEKERVAAAAKRRPRRAHSGVTPTPKPLQMAASEKLRLCEFVNKARRKETPAVEIAKLLTQAGIKIPYKNEWWAPTDLFQQHRGYYDTKVHRVLKGK